MRFDISNTGIELLRNDLFIQKQVEVSFLRLDRVHPVVSGNKLFKLYYFIEEALVAAHQTVLTFGGAHSNHLVATAFACQSAGLKSIGIVRGEKPAVLSNTLTACLRHGMQLKFISRKEYALKEKEGFLQSLKIETGEAIIIPEGGYHPMGANGAALIMKFFETIPYSHICTAIGTATTLAGLLLGAEKGQTVIGFPVLKGMHDIEDRIKFLSANSTINGQLEILHQYHFGGYAKKTALLIQFMNRCWQQFAVPLDFVYTAKMFYGVMDRIKQDQFPAGSRILCLHTGGLQGNESLPEGSLLFQ